MSEHEENKNLPARLAGVNQPERVYYPLERSGPRRAVGPYLGSADSGEGGHDFSLRDILYVLFRHKWKITFIFLMLASGVLIYLAAMPQMYEAEGRLFIRGERNGLVVDPTGEGNSFLKAARDSQSSVRSEIGIIKSAMMADQVVKRLGPDGVLGAPGQVKRTWLDSSPAWIQAGVNRVGRSWDSAMDWLHIAPPKLTREQAAADAVMRGLDVQPNMTESYVLLVTYRAGSPEIAQRVLDTLLDVYQQRHIEIHKNQVSPEFFQTKVTQLKKDLEAKENELDAAKKRLNISSLDMQKSLLLSKFNTYDQALKDNTIRISSLKAKVGELESLTGRRSKPSKDGKRVVSAVRPSPYLDQLRGRLIELRMKESDMALRYTDRNPDLIALRDQISQVEKMIKGEVVSKDPGGGGGEDSAMAAADAPGQDMEVQVILAKAELQAESAREGLLVKELNTTQQDLNKLMENEKELKALDREVQILETDYKQYANSQQTAVISDALDRDKISNVAVVQRATLPTAPVNSQRKLMALLGFGILLSLGAGLGWAFALDACNHSIKTSEEAERLLGLPVLVAIPRQRQHKPMLQRGNPA